MMNMSEKIDACQRAYAQVDLDAIKNNILNMKKNTADTTKIIGVIKTDGYGHGAVPIAHCLEDLDCMYGFAVATAEEAHILRKAGIQKPILILGYSFPYSYERLAREEIRPAVFRQDSIEQLEQAAIRAGKKMKVHIKVDTGMNRIGICPDDSGLAFVKRLMEKKNIEIEGIFTHFSRADETNREITYMQFHMFQDFVERVESTLGISIPMKHCANSAGILEHPMTHMDMVRAGITLYGLYPSDEVRKDIVPLQPALSLYSRIVYIKTIKAGESISYGGTYTAQKDMRIATIPVGYGDGYPRMLSNKGYVLIHGKKAAILGRVCMDQFMVDVSDIPMACEGDKVTLIGKDGKESISAELLGELSGRFNYELVCDLGKRIPRVYLENGKPVGIKDYFEDYE